MEGVLGKLAGEKGVRLAAAWLLAVAPLAAQETPVFHSGTTLALVRFHVVQKGRYVEGLKPDDVVLLDNGEPRTFTVFESAVSGRRTIPVELSVVFDTSGSVMNEGLLNPLVFRSEILKGLDNVRVAVYGFSNELRRYCPPTRDYETLRAALEALRDGRRAAAVKIPIALPPKRKSDPRGGTWIYEAAIGVARDVAPQPPAASRILVIFSDGFGTTTSTPEDAAKVCEEMGVTVDPVVLGHWKLLDEMRNEQQKESARSSKNPSANPSATADRLNDKQTDIEHFGSLGRLTGGHAFDPPQMDLTILRRILAGLVGEVRTEYVVGFTPDEGEQGRRHKLTVRLRDKSAGQVVGGTRVLGN
jgi:VWFA-related protein